MAIHDVLAGREQEVLERWKARVRALLDVGGIATFELVDHVPQFLAQILVALRRDAGSGSAARAELDTTAAGHGEQRLRLGFSLDAVVREYGALQDAIVDTVRAAGSEVRVRELELLSACIVSGIAHAVSEYARQRDAELARHANEHFAFIAHELRNPLSTATTAFELLKRSGGLPHQNRVVDALERALRETRELVDQTLNTARIASGIELRRRATTLRALFDDAEASVLAEAQAKNVEVRRGIERDETIFVDPRLVRSALGNLLRNAVKYTEPGGVVELRAHVEPARVVIEIEDSCGGLPPGKVEAAFAPFVRLDAREPGFGLGLAIAKQAADAHGGSVRVQNLPGKGCVFVLELPNGHDAPRSS